MDDTLPGFGRHWNCLQIATRMIYAEEQIPHIETNRRQEKTTNQITVYLVQLLPLFENVRAQIYY
jgi:hypothetical protein